MKRGSDRNRRIRVAYGRTFNLGNYQSERVDVESEFDLLPGESKITEMKNELVLLKEFVLDYKKAVMSGEY